MFYEIPIIHLSTNPKAFQVLARVAVGSKNRNDLIAEINPGVMPTFHLGVDKLPCGLEDIREFLKPQPSSVYGWLDAGSPPKANYFGIEELI